MTANIALISGGTTYYISLDGGKRTYYSGSGTPWTTQSTTPYDLAMNDVTGQRWSPRVSTREEVYGGGPPFRNGQTPIYDSYGNVIEQVPIQVYATSHDNAVKLLQQLREILNTALFSMPCILSLQPDGATNIVYYDIYGADVQEDARFINDESQPFQAPQSKGVLRAVITWRRSPHGGRVSSGETLINAQTYTVAGSTVTLPTNLVAYSAGAGDLINEGQPLNIKVLPSTAASDIGELWAASVYSQTTGTVNSALSAFPTSPVTANLAITNALTRKGLKLRVIGRVSNTAGGASTGYYIYVRGSNASGGTFLYVTPGRGVFPTTESTGLVDYGGISLDVLRAVSPITGNIQIDFYATKYNGGTANLISIELLFYYDFCKISGLGATQAAASYVWINSFQARTGYPCLPTQITASTLSSADALFGPATVRGGVPRYVVGSSLWLNWLDSTGNNTSTGTRAATVTATHAPLYQTLRGAG